MADLERVIKELIVEACMLDDINPDEIESEMPIFGKGLELDSIDAIEISMAIKKRFGVDIEGSDEEKRSIFSCVAKLAEYVDGNLSEEA